MKKISFLIILTIFLILIFSLGEQAKAGTGDNVSGWAWSENIGWIRFNNCDLSVDPPVCDPTDYGVNVDLGTGVFSSTSYAWSENIGWIWLTPTDIPPGETVANPAKLDVGGGECGGLNQVCGWARACAGAANPDCTGGTNPESGGWDGWIKLRGQTTEATPTDYGVSLNTALSPKEFEGWAWSDMVIGWMSFNCSNQGVCLTSDYSVFIVNQPPSITFPPDAVINPSPPSGYCGFSSSPITLNWTFSDPGDTQSAYQVQVDNNSDFSSPEVDSLKVFPSASTSYAPSGLLFNTTYYWRVTVWDSADLPSGWATGPSFTTNLRPPLADFTWAPPSPSVGEIIQFCSRNDGVACLTDETTFYGTLGTESWAWDFENDGIDDCSGPPLTGDCGTGDEQNPTHSYSIAGDYTVRLTATDDNGSCFVAQDLIGLSSLPEWKEIAPIGLLERFLASIFRFFQT